MLSEELKNYFVDDLVYDDTKIIFVLESPHTDEVQNGYPVAGKSGRDISKVLLGVSDSFGGLIYEQTIKNFGIVNISNYPLQKSAYRLPYAKVLELFDKIRQNPKFRKNDKDGINSVIKEMLDDFKSRLELHKDKKIVLCGNFAQSAFDEMFKDEDFKMVLRVPHPSFNNWKKDKYKEKIQELKRFIG